MATITKRSDISDGRPWQALVRRRKGGKLHRQSKRFATKAEAQRWAAELELEIYHGRKLPSTPGQRVTVADLARRYFDEELPQLRSPHSRRQQIEWLLERIGQEPLDNVNGARLSELLAELAAEPSTRGVRSSATVRRYYASWRRLLELAVRRWHLISVNPAAAVDVRAYRDSPPRQRFLSDDEQRRLLDACAASDNPWLRPFVLALLVSGCRTGELLQLTWGDVDLERGRATIPVAKNGRPRVLLFGPASEALAELRQRSPWNLPHHRLFPNLDGTVPRNSQGKRPLPQHLRTAYRRALEAAGIDPARHHDLRHTTASNIAADGGSLLEIGQVLGHQSPAATARYAHLAVDRAAATVERAARRFKGGT